MAKSPVDRDRDFMYQNWGTTRLVTDYVPEKPKKKQIIQEIMHDDLEDKEMLREDWNYGIEPSYK
jgi:hypothetical protein